MTKPRLLDEVRSALRVKHYSIRTEDAYIGCLYPVDQALYLFS